MHSYKCRKMELVFDFPGFCLRAHIEQVYVQVFSLTRCKYLGMTLVIPNIFDSLIEFLQPRMSCKFACGTPSVISPITQKEPVDAKSRAVRCRT